MSLDGFIAGPDDAMDWVFGYDDPNPLIDFENYPFTDRGWYLPAFTPHTVGSSINALKGHFQL